MFTVAYVVGLSLLIALINICNSAGNMSYIRSGGLGIIKDGQTQFSLPTPVLAVSPSRFIDKVISQMGPL